MAPVYSLLLLLLLSSSSSLSTCQAQPNSNSSLPSPPQFSSSGFNASTAIIIVILIVSFFFLAFFSVCLRQCGGNRRGGSSSSTTVTLGVPATAARSRRGANRGLEQAVIESFPTVVYSDVKEHKIGKGGHECAVCLSDFEDDEELRLLPHCNHVFHSECIDKWLCNHDTCPVCRANPTDAPASKDGGSCSLPHSHGSGGSCSLPHGSVPMLTPMPDVPEEGEMPDHMVIPVHGEMPNGDRSSETPAELMRMGSKRSARSILAWGSRSARTEVTERFWSEEDRERFTLRLPEDVRRDVLAGKLSRSTSVQVFPGEGSSRRGIRGDGSNRVGGGTSFRKSDRWAFLTRPLSFKLSRGGGEGSSKRHEDDTEASPKEKMFAGVGGPLECIGGGGGPKTESDDEAPMVMMAKV